ncbi:hypothetical protein N2152v2_003310 [Parachlorella kessleri]
MSVMDNVQKVVEAVAGDKLGDVSWNYDKVPDQSGKTFVVTGGSSGLGFEFCKQLAAKNANVVLAARNVERSDDAIDNIRQETKAGKISFEHVDLASLKSVKDFADRVNSQHPSLQCLINNAGVQIPEGMEKTQDGIEVHIGVNFLGHFYLTHLLLPKIQASAPGSRIVFMSSPEESRGFVPWDDLTGKSIDRTSFDWYGAANLCKLMVGKEIARRLEGSGVDLFVVQPGMTTTDLFRKMDFSKKESTAHNKLQQVGGQTLENGAISTIYAATEPSLQGKGGLWLGPYYTKTPIALNVFQTMPQEPGNDEAKDPAKSWAS